MKMKKNARDKRVDEERRRKEHWTQKESLKPAVDPELPVKPVSKAEIRKQREEETREFLAYLEKDITIIKDEGDPVRQTARKRIVYDLNLEEGMPVVEEAVVRMNLGLQQFRATGVKFVRLIHGYGSTGRGGKIGISVRRELVLMKNRRRIREFVTGEEFGPCSEESRRMVEASPEIARDQDYGRCNHGITIVML